MSDMSAMRGNSQARAFAAKGGDGLSSLLHTIWITKAAERRGAVSMMCFLLDNFDDDERASIPVVGSKMGETGNLPYDHYTVEITTADGKRKVPGSWFTDAIKATEEARDINRRINWYTGTDTTYTDGTGATVEIPEEYVSVRKTGTATEKAQELRDALSDMRTGLTKGAMLFHHCETIAALSPEVRNDKGEVIGGRIKVKLPFRTEKVIGSDGEPVKNADGSIKTKKVVYGSKIRTQDPMGEEEDKVYSVSSFLQLKPEAIDKTKLTLTGLDKTGARPPKATPPTTTALYPVPTTVEQLLSLLNSLSAGLDIGTDQGKKLESMMLAGLAKDGKGGDEVTVTVCTAGFALDNLYTVANKRNDAINAEKAKANAANRGTNQIVATQQ